MTQAKHTPWYDTGENLRRKYGGMTSCTCCGRDLSSENKAVRYLELDQRTNTYHDERNVPDDRSQGWFPFGLVCAKKAIKAHLAAIAKATGDSDA